MATWSIPHAAALTLALTSCAMEPMPIARSAADPSSPSAPSAPWAAAGAEGVSMPAAMQMPAAAQTFVCPMHADVTASEPGECPKCHMKLVPKP